MQRVAQQVEQHLSGAVGVGTDGGQQRRNLPVQRDLFARKLRLQPLDCGIDQRRRVTGDRVNVWQASLGLRDFLQVAHQPLQTLRLAVDQMKGFRRGRDHAILQPFHIALDAGKRGLEFVADVGHQLAARVFRIGQRLRHAVEVVRQFADLVVTADHQPPVVMPARDVLTGIGHRAQAACDAAAHPPANRHRAEYGDPARHQHRLINRHPQVVEQQDRAGGFLALDEVRPPITPDDIHLRDFQKGRRRDISGQPGQQANAHQHNDEIR